MEQVEEKEMSFAKRGFTVHITPEQIRDELLSLPDNKRELIVTDPKPGQRRIIGIRRNENDNLEYDFEDVPE